jgi:MerR family transcriptional regulator, repressor of the yfmOP operon
MKTYKIEQVAEQCGLTKRTIRYYEEIGLLFPPERSEGGFRLYSVKHIERLKQIVNARDVLGISLNELQEFVSINEELDNLRMDFRQTREHEAKQKKLMEFEATLGKQLTIIDHKIEKLTVIRKDLSDLFERVLQTKNKITSDQE